MSRFGRSGGMALVLAATMADAGLAREVAVGPATWSVAVRHVDQHPRSPAAARRSLARLGDAALRACGADPFSLAEVQASVRASRCWRESMVDVLARIGDPMLTAVYRGRAAPDR